MLVGAWYSRIFVDLRHESIVTVWTSLHKERCFLDLSVGSDELDLPGNTVASTQNWPKPDVADLTLPSTTPSGDEAAQYLRRRGDGLRRASATTASWHVPRSSCMAIAPMVEAVAATAVCVLGAAARDGVGNETTKPARRTVARLSVKSRDTRDATDGMKVLPG